MGLVASEFASVVASLGTSEAPSECSVVEGYEASVPFGMAVVA